MSNKSYDITEMFKTSMEVFTKNPAMMMPTVILDLLFTALVLTLIDDPQKYFMPQQDMESVDPSQLFAILALGMSNLFGNLFVHGVTLSMAREALETGRTTIMTGFRALGQRFLVFFTTALIITTAIFAGITFFLIPGLAAAFFFLYAMPAVVVEGLAPTAALKRSIEVVKDNWQEVFLLSAILVLGLIVVGIVNMVLAQVPYAGPVLAVLLNSAYAAMAAIALAKTFKDMTAQQRAQLQD